MIKSFDTVELDLLLKKSKYRKLTLQELKKLDDLKNRKLNNPLTPKA